MKILVPNMKLTGKIVSALLVLAVATPWFMLFRFILPNPENLFFLVVLSAIETAASILLAIPSAFAVSFLAVVIMQLWKNRRKI